MLGRILALPLLALITLYRRVISPGLPARCRFLPTCSDYAEQSIRRHGVCVGLLRTTWRLARCHPFCKGGYDPP